MKEIHYKAGLILLRLGQTKPYVSRLGSCQCCTLKIEISDCNEFGFFGQLLDVYLQKNLSYLTDNFPKQGYKVLFFPYPAATMFKKTTFFLQKPILRRPAILITEMRPVLKRTKR